MRMEPKLTKTWGEKREKRQTGGKFLITAQVRYSFYPYQGIYIMYLICCWNPQKQYDETRNEFSLYIYPSIATARN